MVAVVQSPPVDTPRLYLVQPPTSAVLEDLATIGSCDDAEVRSYTVRRWVAVVLTAISIWLVITTATTLAAWVAGVGEPTMPGNGGPVVHTVQRGDTVWSVARQYQPGGDVRPFVDEIVGLNGGTRVFVGQELILAP